MTKNTKGVITVMALLAVVAGAWYFSNNTKKAYAKKITKLGGHNNYAVLIGFDAGFLKAWAKALGKGKKDFVYNSENYNTAGGKKIIV